MKNYALITLDPLDFVRLMDGPTNCKSGYAVVSYVREAAPEYDADTHKLEPRRETTTEWVKDYYEEVPLSSQEVARRTFDAAIAAGYAVPGLSLTLRLGESDRAAFTGLLALVNEGVRAGAKTEDSPVTIAGVEGVATVTVGQFRGIALGYGAHYAGLWQQLMEASA
jgi:hypothetical protein